MKKKSFSTWANMVAYVLAELGQKKLSRKMKGLAGRQVPKNGYLVLEEIAYREAVHFQHLLGNVSTTSFIRGWLVHMFYKRRGTLRKAVPKLVIIETAAMPRPILTVARYAPATNSWAKDETVREDSSYFALLAELGISDPDDERDLLEPGVQEEDDDDLGLWEETHHLVGPPRGRR